MSKLETNTIDTVSGSTELQLGSTNATIIKANDKILFNNSGDGIYLGVTSATASNLLDDYEEGTFTPTLEVGTITGTTHGSYIKIGDLVNVNIYIASISDTSTASAFRVDNLPFQAKSTSPDSTVGSVMLRYLDTGSDTQNLVAYVSHGNNRVQIQEIRDNATYVTDNHSNFTNSNVGIRIGVTYRTG